MSDDINLNDTIQGLIKMKETVKYNETQEYNYAMGTIDDEILKDAINILVSLKIKLGGEWWDYYE